MSDNNYSENNDVWEARQCFARARKILTDMNDDSYPIRQLKNKNHAILSDIDDMLGI